MLKQQFTGMRLLMATMALLFSSQLFAADGTIKSASGDIFINGSAAAQGDKVSSGDTLKTAFGAWMVVEMDDQSTLDVRSNTEVRINEYVYNTEDPEQNIQDVDIVDGTLRFTSGLIAKNNYEDVTVRGGEFDLGVRGTSFTVRYNKATKELTFEVHEGGVTLGTYPTPFQKGSTNTVVASIATVGSIQVRTYKDGSVILLEFDSDGNVESVTYANDALDLAFDETTVITNVRKTPGDTFNNAIINTDG